MLRTLRSRRRFAKGMPIKGIFVLLLSLIFILLLGRLFGGDEPAAARDAVDAFYSFEKDSNFAESWELFHPYMKAKFEKNHYIQDRNHVFMQHFGVTTFEYDIGSAKKVTDWTISMQPDAPPIDVVYRVPVVQHFKSKFGTFNIDQDVFVANHDGEWLILWTYK